MHWVHRAEYLAKLAAFKDKQLIKVITGIRRCGKSTLMKMYQDALLVQGISEERIVAINFENFDFEELTEPKALHAYIKARLSRTEMTYVFFDEIQHVREFHRVIDSLYIMDNIDIYITGSNAWMLSGELATLISGRYVEIKMLPFSFKEYVDATNGTQNLSSAYRKYVETGAFPYALNFQEDVQLLNDYLDGILNTIVVKDIQMRHRFSDMSYFLSVVRFLFDSIGSQVSMKKIADYMCSAGRKVDAKTIEKYVTALTESFVIYQCPRFNIRGKEHLRTLEKYYVSDIGLRHALIGRRNMDIGHILENIVFLELIRRGFKVCVGKVDSLEVDFVATNSMQTLYYQVSASIRNAQTFEREIAPLKKINDQYPKYILTLDDDPARDYNGIQCVNVLDWLMM